jgi:PTS hybrid protein
MSAGEGTEVDRVGLVFVSHSALIAQGLVELARQMAPKTNLVAAGGTDEGGIGTSFDKVFEGITCADSGRGVAVLCDLGSAILTAETALDFLDDDVRSRVRILNAPLVEGGVAAAVAAEIGGDLSDVAAAAETAAPGKDAAPHEEPVSAGELPLIVRSVTIVNKDGLHARPAAEFVKLANSFDFPVFVNGQDARSLLGVMALGLVRGMSAEISVSANLSRASLAEARQAVDALGDLVESGFNES